VQISFFSIDDEWLEIFELHCAAVQSTALNVVLDSLSRVVHKDDLKSMGVAQRNRQAKWRRENIFQRLQLPFELEDSMILVYWYTLENPPIYRYVSEVLNSPQIRLEDEDKVRAVMPFFKGVMDACNNLNRHNQGFRGDAFRGVQFNYEDDRWEKFAKGSQIAWYTVKSVAASRSAVQNFLRPGGCTIFIILNCTGTIIKEFSSFQGEDEVLVMPGSKFEVVEAKRSSNPDADDVFERADIITLRMQDKLKDVVEWD